MGARRRGRVRSVGFRGGRAGPMAAGFDLIRKTLPAPFVCECRVTDVPGLNEISLDGLEGASFFDPMPPRYERDIAQRMRADELHLRRRELFRDTPFDAGSVSL